MSVPGSEERSGADGLVGDQASIDDGVSDDAFLGGRLNLLQPAKGFRGGLDAVMLAASVPGAGLRQVLDVGAGVGTAGLCLATRLGAVEVTLVERSGTLAGLARQNVARNGLSDRVRVFEADITGPAAGHRALGLEAERFDHIIANPPYLEAGRHRLPEDATAAAAFGMDAGGLAGWVRFMSRMAAPSGEITIIHRADALGELLAALGDRFGGVRVLPLHPRAGAMAHRILVRARKGSRAPLELLAGIVLHGDGHAFLPEISAIHREGVALAALAGG